MSGTPVALVEGRRQAGKLVLHDGGKGAPGWQPIVAYELVWGEMVTRQTGFSQAAMLQDGRVLLYGKLTDGALEALGGPLPQDPSALGNEQQAVNQREAREALRA